MIIIKDKENTSLIHLSNSTNVDDYIVQDLYALTIDELYRLLEELDEKIDTPSEPSEPDEPTGDVKLQNIKYAIIKKIMSTIAPDKGFDGMKSVEIDATPLYNKSKAEGIEIGYADGKLDGIDEQKSKLSSITIEVNGTYSNEDGYHEVIVNVQPPKPSQPQTEILLKSITENGEYNYKPENADYFKEANITVNVLPKLQEKQVTVTETNTTVTPDTEFQGLSQVNIDAIPLYNSAYSEGKSDGVEEQKNKLTTIEINSNGTYNKEDGYSEIVVDVKTQSSSYSYLTNTVDEDGLRQLGWSDDDINYFKDNNLHYEWQNTDYIVSQGNKEIVINSVDDITQYKDNPDFEYCPYFEDSSGTKVNELFKDSKYLKGIPILNIGSTTSLGSLFSNCTSLTSIPPLNTSNVTNMSHMFNGCSNLTNIPLLDTSNVTSMSNMFRHCSKLESIPPIDTSKVTDMTDMFYYCTSLTNIPLLDISNVTNMSRMFDGCSKLITIPPFDTSKVTTMLYTFSKCASLTSIPLLDTSNVTNMTSMFDGCSNLTNIPLLDTSNVEEMEYMFNSCGNLTTIPLLDTSKVVDMYFMFGNCSNLTSIPPLNTSNVTNMSRMFDDCINLTTIPPLDTSNVTDMGSMFYYCKRLESLPLLDFSNVTNLSVFFGYSDIATLTDLGGFKDLKINWNSDGCLVNCPNLTKQSVLNVINNLYNFRENGDTTTTRTIKFNSKSLALLSDEEKQIATNKGWVLSS